MKKKRALRKKARKQAIKEKIELEQASKKQLDDDGKLKKKGKQVKQTSEEDEDDKDEENEYNMRSLAKEQKLKDKISSGLVLIRLFFLPFINFLFLSLFI